MAPAGVGVDEDELLLDPDGARRVRAPAQKRAGSRYSPHSSRRASQISPSVASARQASSIAGIMLRSSRAALSISSIAAAIAGLVATGLPLVEYPHLLGLDLVGDAQDLQLAGHRVVVAR